MSSKFKNWVWSKGTVVPGHIPTIWRKDQCGAWIKYCEYGNRKSQFGWEIDHISPEGPTILSNLRPLNCENSSSRSDDGLKCARTAKPYNGTHKNK